MPDGNPAFTFTSTVAIIGDFLETFVTVMPGPKSKSAAFISAGKLAPNTLISVVDGDFRANKLAPDNRGCVPMRVRCASIPNSSYPPQNQRPSIVFESRETIRASRHCVGFVPGSSDATVFGPELRPRQL